MRIYVLVSRWYVRLNNVKIQVLMILPSFASSISPSTENNEDLMMNATNNEGREIDKKMFEFFKQTYKRNPNTPRDISIYIFTVSFVNVWHSPATA